MEEVKSETVMNVHGPAKCSLIMLAIGLRHTGQVCPAGTIGIVEVMRLMHEMQAQCPHGTMAVSLAHARQTGHCMERAASVVEGAAIAAVEPDETAVISTPDDGGVVARWLDS